MIKSKVQSIELPKNFKVLFREDTGVKVNSKFMNAVDPWPETKCSRQDCMVCQTEGKQGRCWRPNVTTKSLVSHASLQEYNLNIVENPAEMIIPEG